MYTGCNADTPIDDWIDTDVCLDPEGKPLPINSLLESQVMQLQLHNPKPAGTVSMDAIEPRNEESSTRRVTLESSGSV